MLVVNVRLHHLHSKYFTELLNLIDIIYLFFYQNTLFKRFPSKNEPGNHQLYYITFPYFEAKLGSKSFLIYTLIVVLLITVGYNDDSSNSNKTLWTKRLGSLAVESWVFVDNLESMFRKRVYILDCLSLKCSSQAWSWFRFRG